MTELPDPAGIVKGEERGYSDWFHVVDWIYDHHMPKGTKFFTEEQMREYGCTEYERGLFESKEENEKLQKALKDLHDDAAQLMSKDCWSMEAARVALNDWRNV